MVCLQRNNGRYDDVKYPPDVQDRRDDRSRFWFPGSGNVAADGGSLQDQETTSETSPSDLVRSLEHIHIGFHVDHDFRGEQASTSSIYSPGTLARPMICNFSGKKTRPCVDCKSTLSFFCEKKFPINFYCDVKFARKTNLDVCQMFSTYFLFLNLIYFD